ncbi:MAG: restriction endonuclease [Deltaproteobacteria bacterium]|nr:restriction endonuclease [Deltaproteobacteria bacterium]
MKILKTEYLLKKGRFSRSSALRKIINEVKAAILSISWPPANDKFILYPEKKANGVVPIKNNFMDFLSQCNWELEKRMALANRIKPGPIDAVKQLPDKRFFAVEWETGNISSSHRALNKMAIGLLDGILVGGILILPSREMYKYLTDRVGNYAEIEPYFPVWKNLSIGEGVLLVIEIEHDGLSGRVPRILKGTDGRALK